MAAAEYDGTQGLITQIKLAGTPIIIIGATQAIENSELHGQGLSMKVCFAGPVE